MIEMYEIHYIDRVHGYTVFCGIVNSESEARDDCFRLGIEFPDHHYWYEQVTLLDTTWL